MTPSMRTDEELAFAPATELRDLIAGKTVSPVEVTRLYLDRIDASIHLRRT